MASPLPTPLATPQPNVPQGNVLTSTGTSAPSVSVGSGQPVVKQKYEVLRRFKIFLDSEESGASGGTVHQDRIDVLSLPHAARLVTALSQHLEGRLGDVVVDGKNLGPGMLLRIVPESNNGGSITVAAGLMPSYLGSSGDADHLIMRESSAFGTFGISRRDLPGDGENAPVLATSVTAIQSTGFLFLGIVEGVSPYIKQVVSTSVMPRIEVFADTTSFASFSLYLEFSVHLSGVGFGS